MCLLGKQTPCGIHSNTGLLQPLRTRSIPCCSRNTAVSFCGSSFIKPNLDFGAQFAPF